MLLKTGMEVAKYYNVFKYRPPIPQKDLNSQGITIVAQAGMKPAPKFVLPGHRKEKIGKETSPDAFIMYNLEKLLATTMDKTCGNASEAIV